MVAVAAVAAVVGGAGPIPDIKRYLTDAADVTAAAHSA